MQQAVPSGEGAMAALLGVELDTAETICAEAADGPEGREVVSVANDNGGGQVVISGATAAVERAIEFARGRGVKRALRLPVSAPFHCALMAPAATAMREALAGVTLAAPSVPLIANVTATKATDPADIAAKLVDQVTAPVRWRESVTTMTDLGVTRFIELGAGKVLSGLARRIAPDAASLSCGTPSELEELVKHVG